VIHLLVVQALEERISLVSRDRMLRSYGIELVW